MPPTPNPDAGTTCIVLGTVLLAALVLSPVQAQTLCGEGGCGQPTGGPPNSASSHGKYTNARASRPCEPAGTFTWQEWSDDKEFWHGNLEVGNRHGDHADGRTVHDSFMYWDQGQDELSVGADPGTLTLRADWEAESWYTGSTTGSYSDRDSGTCF